jgi:putative NADH-flavin reductase
MQLDVMRIAQFERGNAIVGKFDLVVQAAFKYRDASEYEMVLANVRHVARVIDIQNVHRRFHVSGAGPIYQIQEMQPSETPASTDRGNAALPTAEQLYSVRSPYVQ